MTTTTTQTQQVSPAMFCRAYAKREHQGATGLQMILLLGKLIQDDPSPLEFEVELKMLWKTRGRGTKPTRVCAWLLLMYWQSHSWQWDNGRLEIVPIPRGKEPRIT